MKQFSRIAATALFAIGLTGCASTGGYFDDAWITSKVKSALCTDKGISTCTDVNVETSGGVVQLSGFAKDQAEINAAVATAQKTSGVKSVRNDIRLKNR